MQTRLLCCLCLCVVCLRRCCCYCNHCTIIICETTIEERTSRRMNRQKRTKENKSAREKCGGRWIEKRNKQIKQIKEINGTKTKPFKWRTKSKEPLMTDTNNNNNHCYYKGSQWVRKKCNYLQRRSTPRATEKEKEREREWYWRMMGLEYNQNSK